MSRHAPSFCFVMLLVLVSPLRSSAQRNGGGNPNSSNQSTTAAGTVYDQKDNRTVMHATVRICDGGGNRLDEEVTGDDGRFSFPGMQRGSYILQVSAYGFEDLSTEVDLNFTSDRGIPVYLKAVPTDASESVAAAKVSAHEMSMPKSARDSLAAGKKKMYVDKNPQRALADLQAAVAAAPGYYEAYHELALVQLSLGKSNEAETNLRKAIELSSDKYGEADVSLGTILLDRGQSAEGEKTLRRGVELSPDFWMGHYQLGRALLNQEKVSEALNSAEQARSLSPGSAVIYRLLSNIHLRQKDYAALLQDIDAYIKLDPDSPAGIRAKALREQVTQKVSAQSGPTSKP
jgi:tetratricopeptide (TPR) repeat protein